MNTHLLDADEYLHLALHASSVGDHHACMSYLKKVLQQQPAHAGALFLLAAEHAELGLVERAIQGLTAAVGINPELDVARFQLGMLLLDRGRSAEAKQQLSALRESSKPALKVFSQALLAMADANPVLAEEKLTQGLALPSDNAALSAMMQRFLDHLAKENAAAVGALTPATEVDQLYLGAYRHEAS